MQSSATVHGDLHPSFLPGLLDRYVTGDLAEPSWRQLSQALDTEDATPQERLAMAAFFGDALRESGSGAGAFDWPKPDEVQDLLGALRQA